MYHMKELSKTILNIKLSEIALFLGKSYRGEDILLDGFNLNNREIEADSVISYCTSGRYFRKALKNSKVKALIVNHELFDNLTDEYRHSYSFIISDSPEWDFYKAFIDCSERYLRGIHYENNIPKSTVIHEGAIIEAGVVFGENVIVGSNTVIKSGTIIGNNVTIGSCSVIGGEGFQLIKDDNGINHTIPHIGRTYIGNDVTIGDLAVVTKSLFEGYTKVMDNVKIDNFVHVSHNCVVGKNSVITGYSAMMGSSTIGKNVWIAPKCTIMNGVHVGDGAFVCACSFVCLDVKPGSRVSGNPAQRVKDY